MVNSGSILAIKTALGCADTVLLFCLLSANVTVLVPKICGSFTTWAPESKSFVECFAIRSENNSFDNYLNGLVREFIGSGQ
jgi:hypothetical protein